MPITDVQLRDYLDVLCTQILSDSYSPSERIETAELIESVLNRVRWIAVDDLVGTSEIADYFQVGASTVSNWAAQRDSNGMPAHLVTLRAGRFWSMTEVVTWWNAWNPVKGAKVGKPPLT